MDLISHLAFGFAVAVTPMNLLLCLIGALVGTLIGVLPGIGPLATIAMLLPITFGLPPLGALIMLAGIYYGAQYGGSPLLHRGLLLHRAGRGAGRAAHRARAQVRPGGVFLADGARSRVRGRAR